MTTYALATGCFSAGAAILVLLIYSAAVLRRCIPWRLGVHVVVVAADEVALVILSTITLAAVPAVRDAQPWRAPLLAVVFTSLSIGLVLILRHVRTRIATSCTRGHHDVFHRVG